MRRGANSPEAERGHRGQAFPVAASPVPVRRKGSAGSQGRPRRHAGSPGPVLPARKVGAVPSPGRPAWPFEEKERGDFLHRIRVFPPEVREWREALVARALEERETFPRVPKHSDREKVRELVDSGISALRELVRALELLFGLGDVELDAVAIARVLGRIDLHPELGFAIGKIGPRDVERSLELVPPNLRLPLKRLLTRLGGETCIRTAPSCGTCEVRRFCATYRASEQKRASQSRAPTMIDLFAGAGGLSLGLNRAGFRSLGALDFDAPAMRTFRFNHPDVPSDHVICDDVRNVPMEVFRAMVGDRPLDLLAGAPPCQGFSQAGFRSKQSSIGYKARNDDRNYLFENLVEVALALKPRLFVMENVPAMGTVRKEDLSFLETARRILEDEGGYRSAIWRLNAAAVGAPQDRLRCILVAARGVPLPLPPAEDYQEIRRSDYDLDALPAVTIEEAIFDLPPRKAGEGSGVALHERPPLAPEDKRERRYLRKFRLRSDSRLLFNHMVRYHNERDLELYALLKPGEDSVHAIERYGRADLMRYRTDVFDDKYSRLRPDKPSKTIVAHLAKDGNGYIHPHQNRSISIREAARLQSFPDDFAFTGSPSDQWVQVGNAVAPIVGEAIGRSFLKVLGRAG